MPTRRDPHAARKDYLSCRRQRRRRLGGQLQRLDDNRVPPRPDANPLAVHAQLPLHPGHVPAREAVGAPVHERMGTVPSNRAMHYSRSLPLPIPLVILVPPCLLGPPVPHLRAFSGRPSQVRTLLMSCCQPGSVSYTTCGRQAAAAASHQPQQRSMVGTHQVQATPHSETRTRVHLAPHRTLVDSRSRSFTFSHPTHSHSTLPIHPPSTATQHRRPAHRPPSPSPHLALLQQV